jgi:SAM-dependent methyltransferase
MEEQTLQAEWDSRHADPDKQPRAAGVLVQNRHLLPREGRALDLACGLGGNALLLARQGLEVTAWDISPIAIERLKGFAQQESLLNLTAEVRDVEQTPLTPGGFDVILVSYYLERPLVPMIIQALAPGGLLFYQTFTRVVVGREGPTNPDFRLADNELLELFSPLKLRVYREENRLGELSQGTRDIAMLVAEKSAEGADPSDPRQ